MRHRMARSLVTTALLLGSAAAAPAFNSVEKDSPFGVVDHTLYDEVVNLNAVWMRHPEAIFEQETAPGVWTNNWDYKLGVEMEPRGINFAPVISIGRCWMSGYTGTGFPVEYPSMPPADLSDTWSPATGYSASYYDYIYTIISQHRGRLDHLTVENEANATNFWGGTAEQYIRVLKTAYLAAHAADSTITVFDSGLGSGVWGACILRDRYESGLYSEGQLLDFANAYYARDAYTGVQFDDFDDLRNWLYDPFVDDQYHRATYMLANMKDTVDALNFKFTEYWWLYADVVNYIHMKTGQAGYSVPFLCNNEASNWEGVSDDQLARELFQKYVVGLSLGVGRTLWFPLSSQLDPSPRVGLIGPTGEKLAGYAAFQTLAETIGHEFAFDHLDRSQADVLQYVFKSRTNPEHGLRVMWYDNANHQPGSTVARFTLPPATDRIVRSDHLGNRTTSQAHGEDYLDLNVSDAPVIVEIFQDLAQLAGTGYPTDTARRRLEQNFPNPFNPETSIRYSIPGGMGETRPVNLTIYDPEGARVKTLIDGVESAGWHTVLWHGTTDDGRAAGPGVYLYRLSAGDVVETRKMILAR